MHRPNVPVSLADLSAAGVRLRPYEVVTIVREVVRRLSRGEFAGVPSPHVIRLSGTGELFVEGPIGAGRDPIARSAQLLEALLPSSSDSAPQFRVPGGLRLVIGRALGTLDLPPFTSLDEFANALGRFGAADAEATLSSLVVTWAEVVASRTADPAAEPTVTVPAQVQPFVPSRARDVRTSAADDSLTVSDIRRARRATGVCLDIIADRSRIPLSLLRQLEWGYLRNWPTGRDGRAQLARYAKAAGLDEHLVVTAISPLLDEIELRQLAVVSADSLRAFPDPPPIDIEVAPMSSVTESASVPQRGFRRRALVFAALATPALVAIMAMPLWRDSSPKPRESVRATQTIPPVAEPAAPSAPEAVTPAPTSSAVLPSARPERRVAPAPGIEPARPAYRLASDVTDSPSFASTGTAMFYQTDEHGAATPLRRAGADSREAILQVTRIVDDRAKNYHVRPSPDGNRIAFDSDRDGVRGVYIADGDGRNVRRVSPAGFAALPSWSPDSSVLAFVRADSPDVWNLWTLNVETGALQQVTRRTHGQPWGASWFPDGQRIAYSHEDRLILHDLRTGTERIFPTPRKGHLVRTPAVSPDGERIMFHVERDGAWMFELADGSMRRILEDPTAEEYSWAPDGKRVAFHSRQADEWRVWVMATR